MIAKQKAQPLEAAADYGSIRIAPVTALADFERCVEVQLAGWGYSDGDLTPKPVFTVPDPIGGQVMGPSARDVRVGFEMALPGSRARKPYLHSHMLAVL